MGPETWSAPIVESILDARTDGHRRVVAVGVGGSVAVGKSTLAHELAETVAGELPTGTASVSVLSTDALLRTNADLDGRGLTMRKGFPESYHPGRVEALLRAVATGAPSVALPEYSHVTYDIVAGSEHPVPVSDVWVVEGVVALQEPLVDGLDVAVYVQAAEEDIEGWFGERLRRVVREAARIPGSFYAGFAGASDTEIDEFAGEVWTSVNAVNLRENIAPSAAAADWIVHKAADHSIVRVERGARHG